MGSYNQYQYTDLVNRESDLYAATKYQIILDFLAGRPNLKILNAGCGSGELSFLLAAAGHSVIGIDPAKEYISLANERVPDKLRERCSFQVGSIETFTTDTAFDCVIATDVLEHIKNDAMALEKLTTFLKPSGDIIITVPALPVLFGVHDELLGHFRRYTKTTLSDLIRSAQNVNIKKIRYFGFTLIPICYLYSKLLRKPYPVASDGKGHLAFIKKYILGGMLAFDASITMPLGTSLILWSAKKDV